MSTYRGSGGEPASLSRLDSVPKQKGGNAEDGIYIRKEVEFHSTTELRDDAIEDGASLEESRTRDAGLPGEFKEFSVNRTKPLP